MKIIGKITTISYSEVHAMSYSVTAIKLDGSYVTTKKWRYPKNSPVIIADCLVTKFTPK